MEEKGRKAVACTGIDDDAPEPPTQTRWPDEERIYFAARDGKGIGAYGTGMKCSGWWLGYEGCMLGRGRCV